MVQLLWRVVKHSPLQKLKELLKEWIWCHAKGGTSTQHEDGNTVSAKEDGWWLRASMKRDLDLPYVLAKFFLVKCEKPVFFL